MWSRFGAESGLQPGFEYRVSKALLLEGLLDENADGSESYRLNLKMHWSSSEARGAAHGYAVGGGRRGRGDGQSHRQMGATGPRIDSVIVEGNQFFSDGQIKKHLYSRPRTMWLAIQG